MNAFYKPCFPIPQPTTSDVGTLFSESGNVVKIEDLCDAADRPGKKRCFREEYCKPVAGTDSLWYVFNPLFCKIKDLLQWGSVGVVTKKSDFANERFFRYAWRMIDAGGGGNELEKFFMEVHTDPTKFLLLGKTAELLYRRLDTNNKHELACLALVPDRKTKIAVHEGAWLKTLTWSDAKTGKLFEGVALHDNVSKAAWKNYIDSMDAVTKHKQHAIIYIPAVCAGLERHNVEHAQRGAESPVVLAGGLIWCVDKSNFGKILKLIPDGQIFLRWVLSEILKTCPEIGMSDNKMQKILDNLYQCKGDLWFTTGSDVPHDWDSNIATIEKIGKAFGLKLSKRKGNYIHAQKLFESAKEILLDKNEGYEFSPKLLEAMLKGVSPGIKVSCSGSGGISFSKFCINKRKKIDALCALVTFLSELPESNKQTISIEVIKVANGKCLIIKCNGQRSKNPKFLDYAKLDSNCASVSSGSQTNNITVLWVELKRYLSIDMPAHKRTKQMKKVKGPRKSVVRAVKNELRFVEVVEKVTRDH